MLYENIRGVRVSNVNEEEWNAKRFLFINVHIILNPTNLDFFRQKLYTDFMGM